MAAQHLQAATFVSKENRKLSNLYKLYYISLKSFKSFCYLK